MQNTGGDATTRTVSLAAIQAQPALSVSAFQSHGAPNPGGCISDVSSSSIHGCEHDYAAAMKTYGVIYQQYQAYLLPTNQLPPHDYDLAAAPVPAFNHLGCLNEDLLESTVPGDAVSDDEIEDCGYLGWLHH